MANGIPHNCLEHPDVEWITIRLPVYTGEVNDNHPSYLEDRLAFRILNVDECVGLNRVCEGYRRVFPNPSADRTPHTTIARWVFAAIGQAFNLRTPGPKQTKIGKT